MAGGGFGNALAFGGVALERVGEGDGSVGDLAGQEVGGEDFGDGAEADFGVGGGFLAGAGSGFAVGADVGFAAADYDEDHACGGGLLEEVLAELGGVGDGDGLLRGELLCGEGQSEGAEDSGQELARWECWACGAESECYGWSLPCVEGLRPTIAQRAWWSDDRCARLLRVRKRVGFLCAR